MTTAPPSPKRRHILSSINPERPPITEDEAVTPEPAAPPQEPRPDIDADADGDAEHAAEEQQRRRRSKFRFKSKHSSSRRSSRRHRDREGGSEDNDDHEHDSSFTTHRHHRHHSHDHDPDRRHHHHRHKRRKRYRHRTRTRSPTPPNPYDPPPLSPDAAFRASLFDAMADDEGAAYWEAVYGQPLHVYSRDDGRSSSSQPQQGELEKMDDEEYAAYVRQRMWEKTHEGLLEERARREEARRAREDREKHARRLTREMEDSLRRGEERRARRRWRDRWEAYRAAWAEWAVDDQDQNDEDKNAGEGKEEKGGQRKQRLADVDPAWPVESGRRADVAGQPGAVREFLVRGLDAAATAAREGRGEGGEAGESEAFLAALKDERVRWHPDKIQQRLGGRVDGAVMRDVTAVFQIVDGLWSDTRERCKKGRRGGLA
ncbi:hypothetical protein DL764_001248 [Monosporascus ibericus]|uniref:Uncharacterized protein n=1 Tax=Monosporascus ibericus TaxID=155417 RepID=A0A4Q4TVH2_9PEZI|nr:hypothetical protein DL764_001248 [Monosporascus ibericus]